MERNPLSNVISFARLLLLSMLLLLIDLNFPLTFLKEAAGYVVNPIAMTTSTVTVGVKDVFREITSLRDTYRENRNLRQEIIRLKGDLIRQKELEEENALLKGRLNVTGESAYSYVLANVIGFGATNLSGEIIINKGKDSGIVEGMPAVLEDQLVGIVTRVMQKSCVVELVISSQSQIPAMAINSRGEQISGVLDGEFGIGLRMKEILQDAGIESGNAVLTSGRGGTLPRNLALGEIEEVFQDPHMVSKEARVKPLLDFGDLEKILIILETDF